MSIALEQSLRRGLISLIEPPPDESAADWCIGELEDGRPRLWIPAMGNNSSPGPFTFDGREYARAIVDGMSDPATTDEISCLGSQSGKTQSVMAGLAARMNREAIAGIWAMPNTGLARSFSGTRWMPFIESSAAFEDLIPKGAKRHQWAALEQRLGASLLNFIGSNSPANLSSRPAPLAIADETDKFNEGTKKEADALNLLDQRTKDFPNPKRVKTSTPTVPEGPIWQAFLAGTQDRYFVPCPHCRKKGVFTWSKKHTVFKITGAEFFVTWDPKAKLPRGRGSEGTGWDLDRVEKSARAICWSCGGDIQDGHKTHMIREGVWTATNPYAQPKIRSRHLPSLYASSPETRFGKEAVKFLQAKFSLTGLRGFINGELAEPDQGQGFGSERIEIISPADAPPLAEKTFRYLAADFQEVRPHWAVCREFDGDGNSRLVCWFMWEDWNEFRNKQIELGVKDKRVGVDSGHKATQEVYPECNRYGERVLVRSYKPDKIGKGESEWFGWNPMKGREASAFWTDAKGLRHLVGIKQVADFPALDLLEFNGPHIKDIHQRLRTGQTKERYELNQTADETYFRHLDGDVRVPVWKHNLKRVIHEWAPRTKKTPIHLKDCEIMILAMVMRDEILKITPERIIPEKSK